MEMRRELLGLDVMMTHEETILLVFSIARRILSLLDGYRRPGDELDTALGGDLTYHNILNNHLQLFESLSLFRCKRSALVLRCEVVRIKMMSKEKLSDC